MPLVLPRLLPASSSTGTEGLMFAHDQVWEQLEATRILATDIRAGAVKPH